MKKLEDRPWWPELVELKDVMSLRELSDRFGAAPAAISNALKRNGMPRNPAPPGPRSKRDPSLKLAAEAAVQALEGGGAAGGAHTNWGRKAPAATAPVTRTSRATKAPTARASGARSGRGGPSIIASYAHLLGKVIDREIAEKAHVSVSAVTNYRKRHGIESASARARQAERSAASVASPLVAVPPVGATRKAATRKVAVTPAAMNPVAVTPAAVTPVAVTPAAVTPAAVTPAAVTPAAVTPAAVAPAVALPKAAAVVGDRPKSGATKPSSDGGALTSGFGYKVTIGGREYVVVAQDIAVAASRVLQAAKGTVTSIELLGSAIGG